MFAPQAIEIIKILEKENQSRAMANGLQAKSRGCFGCELGKKRKEESSSSRQVLIGSQPTVASLLH